ncbi:hypothetical protein Tco_0917674 [Tanacetum coccineum]
MTETSYELLKDDQKKQLSNNNESKIARKEYKRVFMCKTAKEVWHTLIITHQSNSQVKDCKIDLLIQHYEKFSISNEETIDSGFTSFNAISAKVTTIKEAKYLATLPFDELIGKSKVYEMILENDGVASKTTKEKVRSLAIKAKVTREQTSDDSDSQGGNSGTVINLAMRLIDLEEAAEMALETKEVKTQDKGKIATIAAKKVTSLVNVQSPKRTRLMSKELRAIVKTAMNHKMMQHVSWQSTLKRYGLHKVCLKCDLLLEDWIVDSGCTKHMIGNRILFTLYNTYDGGHVVFGSNLKGKVISGVSFTKVDCTISKNGKMLDKGHRRNGLCTCKLGDNSKQQICLASMVDNSTLWHRRLGHANVCLPDPKSSPSVEDDRINEPIVQYLNGSPSLQVNVLDEGYPKSVKKARGHLIEQVIGELNEKTLRRLSGLDCNNKALPYARFMTTLFEYLKNKHPNDASRMLEVEEVTPM